MDNDLPDLDGITDPAARVAAAQALIEQVSAHAKRVYDYAVPIRRAGISELREGEDGLGYTRLAALLNVSRTRAQQLVQDAERAKPEE